MRRRVVVTGIGAITPIGCGVDGLWAGVRRGVLAGGAITRFDASPFRSRVAAEIRDFDPLYYVDSRKARRLDRFAQMAISASCQALADAGRCAHDACRDDTAVYIGSALGGVAFAEEQHRRYLSQGLGVVQPSLALSVFGGSAPTNVAMEFGFHGPAMSNADSCASGLIALGEAFRCVRSGGATVALAGGAEAPLAPLTFGAFDKIHALTTTNDHPECASRPFDGGRDGFLMAEGAAVLQLEELEHALGRGASPYAEVLGYATTNDAHHMTAPLPSGREAARAMSLAMADGGITPADVGYVNAHATGTPLGDAAESRAIRLAFGARGSCGPLVSGTKGMHGHALGASGAIETAITCLALQRRWLPPTANLRHPDPECDLHHVRPGGMEAEIDIAMANSFGFGGINASLVLRRWPGL